MKPEETVDYYMRWTWHKIARMYNTQAEKMGGSMSVGYILLSIDKDGSPSTSLGPKMGMEPRSLTRILRAMEDEGLIYRVHGEEDRRNVFMHLTEEGKKMRRKARATVLKYNEFIRENIPAKKLDEFFKIVEQINELTDPELVYPTKKRGN